MIRFQARDITGRGNTALHMGSTFKTKVNVGSVEISDVRQILLKFLHVQQSIMGCLQDPANVQQTSSKCIQNTRANAGRLLKVCWKFAGRWAGLCKHPIRYEIDLYASLFTIKGSK